MNAVDAFGRFGAGDVGCSEYVRERCLWLECLSKSTLSSALHDYGTKDHNASTVNYMS